MSVSLRTGPHERGRSDEHRTRCAALSQIQKGSSSGVGGATAYFRGSTTSFSCFAIRAFTTVLAGILMASPVAGFRPMRALRF